jgi:hypothetical protein
MARAIGFDPDKLGPPIPYREWLLDDGPARPKRRAAPDAAADAARDALADAEARADRLEADLARERARSAELYRSREKVRGALQKFIDAAKLTGVGGTGRKR